MIPTEPHNDARQIASLAWQLFNAFTEQGFTT